MVENVHSLIAMAMYDECKVGTGFVVAVLNFDAFEGQLPINSETLGRLLGPECVEQYI